jgi:hypothetical protein
VELRARAGGGRAAGDRARLLHGDAAAPRAVLRVGAGRRLGPAVRAARGAAGQPDGPSATQRC